MIGLCNDLDNMVRTLERTVYKNRISLDDEHITNASAALHNLAWYHAVVEDDGGSDKTKRDGVQGSRLSPDGLLKEIEDASAL